jgi:hypothetical protein
MIGATEVVRRRRFNRLISPAADRAIAQLSGTHPEGNPGYEPVPVVVEAVVDTITAKGAAAPAVTVTEPGRLQFGAGVTTGVMAQLRVTLPANDPVGVTAKLNVAV